MLAWLAVGCGDDEVVPTTDAGDAGDDEDAAVNEADAEAPDDAGEDAGEPDAGGPVESNQAGLVIELSDGVLEGEMVEGTRTFSNIPFAAPPVGELRFRPPQPVEPWAGMLDATGPGVACPQNDEQIADGTIETSEDCLQLNVFAPAEPPDAALPVMIWIHGGSNVNGSANQLAGAGLPRIFDGAVLRADAARDVVVVTLNYRMGALGFLAHSALRAEQGNAGNYALLDQQAALRWVQHNIAAFGGDPENVTLFGESAGAWDTCYQMVATGSEGLFHRAILESGSCSNPVMTREQAEAYADDFAARVGCDEGDDATVVACLRALSLDEVVLEPPATEAGGGILLTPEDRVPYTSAGGDQGLFAVVDGELITKQPAASFAAGEFARVPMIIGTNAREASLFLQGPGVLEDEAQLRAALEAINGAGSADAVLTQYPVSDYDSVNDAAIAALTDFMFVCPARSLAALASEHVDVYVYNWTRGAAIPPFSGLGATHAVELSWVWNFWPLIGGSAEEQPLTELTIGYWTRMAEAGDPNGDDAPEWPLYSAGTDPELAIDLEPMVEEGRRNAACAFWDDLAD